MGQFSKIQWTDATWNIARGCTKVNSDCKFCYMYRDSLNDTRYDPYAVTRTKTVFNLPLKLKEPSKIFTCSLTDFFHPGCDSFREDAWAIIRACPQHTFQILTKRPERIKDNLPADWLDGYNNVWLGISAGNQVNYNKMMFHFMDVPAQTKFLSAEPLHGKIELPGGVFKNNFHWIIIGGESGNENGNYRYRACKLEWIENLIGQCWEDDIPVFVKQLGTHLSKQLKLSDRHGGNINEFPVALRIRKFPIKEMVF